MVPAGMKMLAGEATWWTFPFRMILVLQFPGLPDDQTYLVAGWVAVGIHIGGRCLLETLDEMDGDVGWRPVTELLVQQLEPFQEGFDQHGPAQQRLVQGLRLPWRHLRNLHCDSLRLL